MFVFAVIVAVAYVWLIGRYVYGWNRMPGVSTTGKPGTVSATILIPFRNEAASIGRLAESLLKQASAIHNVQFLFVDDGSTDGGAEIVMSVFGADSRFLLVRTQGTGKKRALATGIVQAGGDWLLWLDADVTLSDNWLNTMLSFCGSFDGNLAIGPVALRHHGSVFGKMQQLEFQSLAASTGGSAGINRPVMCNAANLAVRKAVFAMAPIDEILHTGQPSGDDMFLLEYLKIHAPETISYVKNPNALVYIRSLKLRAFLRQRMRWVSKAPAYQHWHITTSAAIVALTNVLLAVLLVLSLIKPEYRMALLLLFVTKLIIDGVFLAATAPFFGTRFAWLFIVPTALVYPWYVTVSLFAGLWFKVRWK